MMYTGHHTDTRETPNKDTDTLWGHYVGAIWIMGVGDGHTGSRATGSTDHYFYMTDQPLIGSVFAS